MRILKNFFTLIFCFVFFQSVNAQQTDNCHVRISVLTCAPGTELYATFGHSAVRIIDSARRTDFVFNWGTFDVDEPDFYLKFMRGKLPYYLSVEKFPDFLYEYEYEHRSVTEQLLNIDCDEKNKILQSLALNLQGNNKFYKYDFLFDNCTTRIRDLLQKDLSGFAVTKDVTAAGTTFRNMLHNYLDKGGEPWSKLGIDILLGAVIDRTVTRNESLFLPEFLMAGLNESQYGNTKTVSSNAPLLQEVSPIIPANKYTPLIAFSIAAVLIFFISRMNQKGAKRLTRFFDALLIYSTGILGVLLLFMWLGTDHVVCKNNFNLLWALPTNFIAAFFLFTNKAWIKQYFKIAAGLSAILLAAWFWLPQQMNIALVPLVVLLMFRYYQLSLKTSNTVGK